MSYEILSPTQGNCYDPYIIGQTYWVIHPDFEFVPFRATLLEHWVYEFQYCRYRGFRLQKPTGEEISFINSDYYSYIKDFLNDFVFPAFVRTSFRYVGNKQYVLPLPKKQIISRNTLGKWNQRWRVVGGMTEEQAGKVAGIQKCVWGRECAREAKEQEANRLCEDYAWDTALGQALKNMPGVYGLHRAEYVPTMFSAGGFAVRLTRQEYAGLVLREAPVVPLNPRVNYAYNSRFCASVEIRIPVFSDPAHVPEFLSWVSEYSDLVDPLCPPVPFLRTRRLRGASVCRAGKETDICVGE